MDDSPVGLHQGTPSDLRERLAAERRGTPFVVYRDDDGVQRKGGAHDAVPATNPQIAAELFLTVAAVKTHLRALCRSFGIDELPQQEKRRRLVALAMALGTVRDRDL